MSTEFYSRPVIHVVDDDESMRMALIELLRTVGFDTIGYGSTGEFLLNSLSDKHGCILLDIQLPGPSGLVAGRIDSQRRRCADHISDRPCRCVKPCARYQGGRN